MENIIADRKKEIHELNEINNYINNILIPNWEDKDIDTDFISTIFSFNRNIIMIKEIQIKDMENALDSTMEYSDREKELLKIESRLDELTTDLDMELHRIIL